MRFTRLFFLTLPIDTRDFFFSLLLFVFFSFYKHVHDSSWKCIRFRFLIFFPLSK